MTDTQIFIAVSAFFFGFVVDGIIYEIVPSHARRTVTRGIAVLLSLAMLIFAVILLGGNHQ